MIPTACRKLFSPALFALLAGAGFPSRAETLWTGPVTNFVQSADSPADELVPGAVSLTRAYSQWLYNPDAGDQGPAPGTPTDTEWAFGTIDNYQALFYQSFDSYRNGDLSSLLVGNPMVVHLVNEDIYLSLTFSQWPQHGGFFAYTRSTPAAASPSGPILTAAGATNGRFSFFFTATAGSNYVVQTSSNLLNWTPFSTNTAATNQVLVSDAIASQAARFYRVVVVTPGP